MTSVNIPELEPWLYVSTDVLSIQSRRARHPHRRELTRIAHHDHLGPHTSHFESSEQVAKADPSRTENFRCSERTSETMEASSTMHTKLTGSGSLLICITKTGVSVSSLSLVISINLTQNKRIDEESAQPLHPASHRPLREQHLSALWLPFLLGQPNPNFPACVQPKDAPPSPSSKKGFFLFPRTPSKGTRLLWITQKLLQRMNDLFLI